MQENEEEIVVKEEKPKGKRGKRALVILCSVLLFVASVLGVLQLGCVYTENSWTHFRPDYEKVDIEPLLSKSERTEEEYELLYRQTGLTKLGIDGLLDRGDTLKILELQQYLFQGQKVTSRRFNPFTYTEEIDDHTPMAALEDGDIIVTSTTRVSWWRYGHAAMVVNGESEQVLESISPGADSELSYANYFSGVANFMILRPKTSAETKAKVVEFAMKNLIGLPYRMTVGVLSKKFDPDEIKYSQCAHLVWYAYKKFGIDLDSTGGGVVKPQDMANSEHVEVVQAYGFDLDRLWS